MQKKLKIVGLFLFITVFFVVAISLNVQAGVTVDDTEKTITLDTDDYNMDSIWADAIVGDANLTNYTTGKWRANYSIIIDGGATLEISPNAGATGCTWLQLNRKNESGKFNAYIQVKEGTLWVNDTRITAWNETGDCNQTWNGTFRPYIYVYVDSVATPKAYFLNSTIGYLGYNLDNKYGIVYEDSESAEPQGWMHNCTVMENFHGINFQGCENMNVSDTYFNNTHEVGIVYTVGGDTGGGSHGGKIGDVANTGLWSGQYSKVRILDCYGDSTAMGIRIYGSNNITMEDVEINNAYTEGVWLETVNNFTCSSLIAHHCTNATDDYQISLNNVTNSTFTSCSAYVPDGTADGGNWYIGDSLGSGHSSLNTFTSCRAYAAAAHEDFYVGKTGSHGNTFTGCVCNNSDMGFYIEYAHNNSISSCVAHNHTYDYKILSGDYNWINESYANDSTIGIYVIDISDADLAYHNTFYLDYIYRQSSYGVSVGSDGGADNWCHNNTFDDVRVYGTTTGDGIYFFDNVTYNNATDCFVTQLEHVNSVGFGMSNYAHHNTFYGSLAHSNQNDGFSLMEYVHNNVIFSCTGSSCETGLQLSGNYINNNTVQSFSSHWNDWGLYAWPNTVNNNVNNYINRSTFHLNDEGGIDVGRIGLNTFWNNTVTNNSYGIEVRQSAQPFFVITNSYNSTTYDWVIENSTTTDIYTEYILFPNVVHTVGTSTASVSHDAGDGLWNLTTKPMQITTDSGTCDINVTQYTHNYVQWTGTATAGNLIQYIGELEQGRVYDLLVDGYSTGRESTTSAVYFGNTTYRVPFNYTDGWSTHTFAVRRVTNDGDGGGGTQDEDEEPLDSDGDGYSDAVEIAAGSDPYDATSTPATVAGAIPWYVWAIAIVIALFFLIILYFVIVTGAWKKFKKRFK